MDKSLTVSLQLVFCESSHSVPAARWDLSDNFLPCFYRLLAAGLLFLFAYLLCEETVAALLNSCLLVFLPYLLLCGANARKPKSSQGGQFAPDFHPEKRVISRWRKGGSLIPNIHSQSPGKNIEITQDHNSLITLLQAAYCNS